MPNYMSFFKAAVFSNNLFFSAFDFARFNERLNSFCFLKHASNDHF